MKKIEEDYLKQRANHLMEIVKKENANYAESVIFAELERVFESGVEKGIDEATPWVLVNAMEGTETPFGTFDRVPWDLTEADVEEQFREQFECELGSLIDTYLDLDEFDSVDDLEEKYNNDEFEFDPILTELDDNLYLFNRYTSEVYHYDGADAVNMIISYIESEGLLNRRQ